MPKHIINLLVLISILFVLAVGAKKYFTAESFGLYGHFRGNAVVEIASKVPKLQGSASCESCHKAVYNQWTSGIHRKANRDNNPHRIVVKYGPGCEVCHTGPAGNHPSKDPLSLSIEDKVTTITHSERKVHPANVPGRKLLLPPEDMRNLCLNCHDKLEARPKEQRQVSVDSHGGKELCTTCHNPHSPKIDFAALPRPPIDTNTGKALAVVEKFKGGDANAGKTVAAICAACHGEAGVSVNPVWPNLAGQHTAYLTNSLKAFKSGVRKNDLMSGIAASLSEADIRNVSTYFSNAKCRIAGGDKAKINSGKIKAEAVGCAACHNAGGLHGTGSVGISAAQVWPNLAGQNVDYLVNSLKTFKDESRYHAVMSSVAKSLSDADIDNLAAYFASASCK